MATLESWDITDANNNQPPPDGWPENTMQYSDVNNTGRAVQGTVRRFYGDINGSLDAGGSVNAYTLTLNESGYTSYFRGMYFNCRMPITNTGPSTMNVNGIGDVAILNNGGPLNGGELRAGCLCTFRYDGTNFQIKATGGGTAEQATLTNSDEVDLVDTDVALRIGTDDPDNELHTEFSPFQIQTKGNATDVDELQIQPFGGDLTLGQTETNASGGPWGLQFFRNEETKFEIFDNFLYVSDDTGDPETPDPITLYHQFDEQVGRTYSQVGFDNGVDYKIISFVHGASITLEGESAAGAQSVLIDAAYNGVSLYHEGDERFFTTAQGATLDAPSPDFVISSATGISSNTIDLVDTTTDFGAKLTFDQGVGWFRVAQADGAGVFEKTWLFCNRDDSVDLYFNNAAVARTLAATAGGLEVNNTLTGAGFERVLTTSDIGEGIEAGTNIGQMLEWSTSSSEYEISNNIGGITSGIAVAASTNTPKVNLYRDSLPASLGGSGTQVLEISGEPFAPAIIRNYVVGRGLQAEGRNAGDTAFHTIFSSDPDGDIGFYFNNVEVARTLTAASGGFEVNNTSTGAGFERVLTTSDLTAIGSPQQLVDGGGNVRVRAEGLGRVELRSAANTDTEDRYIDFVYQNSTRKARVGSFATNATGYTSITDDFRISNEGANETVQIFAQNFSSQDFIAAEFGSSVVRLYDGGQEVVRTAGGFSDGLQVDKQNQGLSGVVTVDDIELEDGEIAVGNPSGIGFSTAIINSSTYRTYAGREIQASSTDTLRFGSVGGSPDEVGGLFRCAGSWSLATDGGGASITLIQISTAGGITTQTISTSTLVPITITATGWWRYVGSSSIRIVLVGF